VPKTLVHDGLECRLELRVCDAYCLVIPSDALQVASGKQRRARLGGDVLSDRGRLEEDETIVILKSGGIRQQVYESVADLRCKESCRTGSSQDTSDP
jgi:hypothetical protein